ncbi:MAG TPA: DUF2142 domain-containing protein [Solirubrobacteraceae bacterium]|nr:DUF2142 domain-containing protein [Solirubrobacteraceae bacterium]
MRVALIFGLVALALAVALTLTRSPARVVGSDAIPVKSLIAVLRGGDSGCQPGGAVPRATSALRLFVESTVGPSIDVSIRLGQHVLSRGHIPSAWTGAGVVVPVQRIAHNERDPLVCFTFGKGTEPIQIIGARHPEGVRIEYLAPGRRSWYALALTVARHIGLGRALSGSWVVLLLAALMAAVAILACGLCLRELATGDRDAQAPPAEESPTGRAARLRLAYARVPTTAWICALVAFLNAVSWSILSPPFQVPDETDHFAYVQLLAEAHRLPAGSETQYSPEEQAVLEGLHQQVVRFKPNGRTIGSLEQQRTLEHDLARPLSRRGSGQVGVAGSEPPLYYALETIPYELASSGSLLDRLELMRIFSAIFAGLTALFSFLFVREVLPGLRWAWTVGGLGVALAPLLGFMSGAVNPDGLLYAVAAALFYQLARCFRHGLSPRVGLAIGTSVVIGLLTKLNFLGLVPGVVLALLIIAWRERARSRRDALTGLVLAFAPCAILAIAYVALASSTGHSLSFASSKASELTKGPGAFVSALSYTWQFYLPHLPFMKDYFVGLDTWRQLWFNGLVGLYGWADTPFPNWACEVALVPAAILLLLLGRALLAERLRLRSRLGEGLVYVTMAVGVMALVGISSYFSDVLENEGPYWEPRYLMPMLSLAGVALALAARGAGRRGGPAVGALIVIVILGHDVFSQLLVVSRYYV